MLGMTQEPWLVLLQREHEGMSCSQETWEQTVHTCRGKHAEQITGKKSFKILYLLLGSAA